ncbi:MAG: hypothetical protein Q7U78_06025 [Gallionella sp.]|nr:hypothetical protein [Gallionella sp.]
MSAELILQLFGLVGGAGAVYAAIRSDLTRAIVLAEQAAETAKGAHKRIDNFIGAHHG